MGLDCLRIFLSSAGRGLMSSLCALRLWLSGGWDEADPVSTLSRVARVETGTQPFCVGLLGFVISHMLVDTCL